MIKIEKKAPPAILVSKATEEAIQELINGSSKQLKKSIYKNKSIVDSLADAYHNKCAYCESILDNVNVSNYRPKSKYPWLAYEWSNLMPICPACNSNKRDIFPLKNEEFRIVKPSINKFHAFDLLFEQPLLIHPEIEEPEIHFSFTINGEINSQTEKGRVTIQVCRLDRDFLNTARQKKIDEILQSFKNQIITLENFPHNTKTNIDDLIKLSFTNVFDLLFKSAQPYSEFSLLGKQMIENFDYFFTNNIETESGKEILKKAYQYFVKNLENNNQNIIKQLVIQEDNLLISQTSEDTYFDASNKTENLFYALKQIKIENFNGIIKTEIIEIPIDTRWIFLSGENGFGKTSILQAIVLGFNGTKEKNIPLISNENKVDETKPTKISIEIKKNVESIINSIDSKNFVRFPHFAVYGPSRLNILKAYSDEKRTGQTYNIFNSDGLLLNIENELYEWQLNSDIKSSIIRQLFVDLLKPYIVDIHIENKQVVYFEKDIKSDNIFQPKPFSQLASGFKSLIATIGDMLIRFDKNGQDITNPDKLKGFVIIDEFDLHWHPKWQRTLVDRLSKIFKNIQFIVSTHSILPLFGAPSKSIFIKVNKTYEQGITVERINLDFENLSPNIILSSPLFDTPILSVLNRNQEEFATDEDYIKWYAYDALKKELKQKEEKRKELFNLLNSKVND